jgi:phosphatidylglycerophosphate synthase
MKFTSFIPITLTFTRVLLAPVVVWLALYNPDPIAFGICLTTAFLSDIFDGIIARRLNIATQTLRRLDSIADSIFYISTLFAAWHLHAEIIKNHITSLVILIALEVSRYLFDLIKFRRETSYHMWSSKLWGIFLFIGFIQLLVIRKDGIFVELAIYFGVLADIEGLAISIILKRWKNDVPTFIHALKLRSLDDVKIDTSVPK